MKRYELSTAQWEQIRVLLPGKVSDPGRTGSDNRLFVNGCLWVLRSGAHWCDLPERYGNWKTVHRRFSRWCHAGVWERVFTALTADRDNAYLMIDSTIVRAHQHAATGKGGPQNQALGRSRGGLTTKIHMLADALGRPLRFIITGGQVHDATQASALLEGQTAGAVIADKAYDSNGFREKIAVMNAEAVIPSKGNRKVFIPHDHALYKDRNRIERCFNRLKQFRRFATRYDRRTIHFTGFIYLAAAMIWIA
ncbi:IS5 family transposase [Acetobacter tropicalis]|uniref:IS5/IS1182 family transposase n=2 Tax=Acetobacter TaxID=434 RepID=A0A291PMI8_9PROT|nr:IS5/IS1182 family transposase [Acetobacter tropicalis]ATJ92617.1 IS5/IS1182 family transposase [Acetobacter tropicalis]ATJ92663.1 IS5/IS1182 family transposase [Acetobacter tropicalis]ATJ92667.1 IS5/IS1182 family transposase [Acetobacter tropicalis]